MIRDITRRLARGFPSWPGDPPFDLDRTSALDRGDGWEVTRLSMSLHAGTHLDAPSHVLAGGGGVEGIALETLIGPAEVIDIRHAGVIEPEHLPHALMRRLAGGRAGAEAPRRILFRTESAETLPDLPGAFSSLGERTAALLAGAGARLVGIDTPSVDAPSSAGLPVHRLLAAEGLAILEGLDLRDVPAGRWWLIALPLRLEGVEASPARAVLLDAAPAQGAGIEGIVDPSVRVS